MKISVILLSFLLSGCNTFAGDNYRQPKLSLPSKWNKEISEEISLADTQYWWDNFDDPLLSQVISHVIANNNDLILAGINLQQARLAFGLAETNKTPDIGLSAGAGSTRVLSTGASTHESYSASFSLNYELDLWGKLARTRDQARWNMEASEEDLRNTVLLMIATTAQYYWDIAKFNQQLALYEQRLDIARRSFELVQSRYKAGNISQRDLLLAEQTIISQESIIDSLHQQREATRNAMALIYNHSSLQKAPEKEALDLAQNVPVSLQLPLEVISKRPDIRAAERSLRAALAGADVAKLSFYPAFSLSATLSAGHSVFRQWFNQQTLGQNISTSLPFLQWQTLLLTIKQANLDAEKAEINFRHTVYKALAEIEDARLSRETTIQQREKQRTNLLISEQVLTLTEAQYVAGAISFDSLLNAQDSVLTNQLSIIDNQHSYLTATMKLWQSLGGGEINNNQKEVISD